MAPFQSSKSQPCRYQHDRTADPGLLRRSPRRPAGDHRRLRRRKTRLHRTRTEAPWPLSWPPARPPAPSWAPWVAGLT